MKKSSFNQRSIGIGQVLVPVVVLVLFTGCLSPSGNSPIKKGASAYHEIEHDGRIYVIGDHPTAAKFRETHDLPLRKTYVGDGPKGETVVVQIDKNDSSLQERLWTQFRKANLYYHEEEHDGCIFILGSAITHLKFLNTHDFPYKKTLVGAGAEGKTLVFEIDKENNHQAIRLMREYEARHKVKLKK